MTKTPINENLIIPLMQSKSATKLDELGMREMQRLAFRRRGEQYLLIKSPPASGKSRALMFVALDKLHNQNISKVIVAVPERSIGASFRSANLTDAGFPQDWVVEGRWNLCSAPGDEVDRSKVRAVKAFLDSPDRVLVCTHATFRFAVDEWGIEVFDNCLIAIDEFHHSSSSDENRLGNIVNQLIERDKVHIVAMTGSYFRGDAVPIMSIEDEDKFVSVTYSFFDQLNGYEHLKSLAIGYHFYAQSYITSLEKLLEPTLKTIIHIPNVNSRESSGDKQGEVAKIMESLGQWIQQDPETGFHIVEQPNGNRLKIADLVDDGDAPERQGVITALRDPDQADNRDHVDIIIALGMAKEGFDWIWCEHALTVGYRGSLTEVVQIIGRTTRDAPGKHTARFTNLIAEVDASQQNVVEAINDILKAVAASLLMEQVLTPSFKFTAKNHGPIEGFKYDENGIGTNSKTGKSHISIKGMKEPISDKARQICENDLDDIKAEVLGNNDAVAMALFDRHSLAADHNIMQFGKIIRNKYPDLDEEDVEAVRQHAVASYNIKAAVAQVASETQLPASTALIEGIKKIAADVRDLNIDLIDQVNPFEQAYSVLSRQLDAAGLAQIANAMEKRKITMTAEEALDYIPRIKRFIEEYSRPPELKSSDPIEQKLAQAVEVIKGGAKKEHQSLEQRANEDG